MQQRPALLPAAQPGSGWTANRNQPSASLQANPNPYSDNYASRSEHTSPFPNQKNGVKADRKSDAPMTKAVICTEPRGLTLVSAEKRQSKPKSKRGLICTQHTLPHRKLTAVDRRRSLGGHALDLPKQKFSKTIRLGPNRKKNEPTAQQEGDTRGEGAIQLPQYTFQGVIRRAQAEQKRIHGRKNEHREPNDYLFEQVDSRLKIFRCYKQGQEYRFTTFYEWIRTDLKTCQQNADARLSRNRSNLQAVLEQYRPSPGSVGAFDLAFKKLMVFFQEKERQCHEQDLSTSSLDQPTIQKRYDEELKLLQFHESYNEQIEEFVKVVGQLNTTPTHFPEHEMRNYQTKTEDWFQYRPSSDQRFGMSSQRDKKKVNHEELRQLKVAEQSAYLKSFVTNNKSLDGWCSAIRYVLEYQAEPGDQFDMMNRLYTSMMKINPAMLANALNNIREEFKLCRSLDVFYLSMKYLVSQECCPKSDILLREVYITLTEKYGLRDLKVMDEEKEWENYLHASIREITLAIECLPKLLGIVRRKLNTAAFLPMFIDWVRVYPQETEEQFQYLAEFCKLIVQHVCQEDAVGESNRHNVLFLVLLIITRCGLGYPGSQNLCHAVDSLPEDIIHNFDWPGAIVRMSVDCVIKAFNCLTNCKVTQNMLHVIYAVSVGFWYHRDYLALGKLYKQFVLPRLVRQARKATPVQNTLKLIVDYYVNEFAKCSTLAKEDLGYFIYDMPLRIDKYWVQKAFLSCNGREQMLSEFFKLTSDINKGLLNKVLNEIGGLQKASEGSWQPTQDRLLRQRKKYSYVTSKLSGIKNTSSNCYIISTVQALFMTKCFPDLLEDYYREWISSSQGQLSLLYWLHYLMRDLKAGGTEVRVDCVKLWGPMAFQSQGQQDCHEYLIKLLECVQKEFTEMNGKAKQELVARFKQLFELNIESTLICQDCKAKQVRTADPNVHSIGCQEKLSDSWESYVNHNCDECGRSNPNRRQTFRIVKFPKVLLVHLKRFEYRDGKALKQLDQGELPRQFDNYTLMGFILHIGPNPISGHYVLYCRWEDDLQTWYRFNDEQVHEFKLSDPNEPFERNFEPSETPYILIYRRQ